MDHFKGDCKNLIKVEGNATNVFTEEIQDVVLLVVHSLVDDWVLDLGAPFHTISYREIMQNYVGDFGKEHMPIGEALKVMGVRDERIILPNRNVWTLQKF